jgi:hypothetical protein
MKKNLKQINFFLNFLKLLKYKNNQPLYTQDLFVFVFQKLEKI